MHITNCPLASEQNFCPHINKFISSLHTVFPQYLDILCDVKDKTSTIIPRQYSTPNKMLRIHKTPRLKKCINFHKRSFNATEHSGKLCATVTVAIYLCCDSIYFNIFLTLGLVEKLNDAPNSNMQRIHIATLHKRGVQKIKWVNSLQSIGFFSAVTSYIQSPQRLPAHRLPFIQHEMAV